MLSTSKKILGGGEGKTLFRKEGGHLSYLGDSDGRGPIKTRSETPKERKNANLLQGLFGGGGGEEAVKTNESPEKSRTNGYILGGCSSKTKGRDLNMPKSLDLEGTRLSGKEFS